MGSIQQALLVSGTPSGPSVWNPAIVQANTVLSGGNSIATITNSYEGISGTRGFTYGTGPWSFRVTVGGAGGSQLVGLGGTASYGVPPGDNSNSFGYFAAGTKYTSGGLAAYGAAFTAGDNIDVLLAADGKVTFYKNTVSQGVAFDLAALGFTSLFVFYAMFGSGTGGAGVRVGTIDTTVSAGGATAIG